MQKKQQKRIAAYFLTLLIFVSNIGWSSYARYCSCADQTYTSFFAKSKSECCHRQQLKKVEKAPEHSCCSMAASEEAAKKTDTNNSCKKPDDCCHTHVKYIALDADATLTQVLTDIPTISLNWQCIPVSNTVYPAFIASYIYALHYNKCSLPNAPPPKSGRQILQLNQVMRC